MATAPIIRRYTPAEYLVLEREAPFKNEYRNGYIVAMAGAKRNHNRVAGNFYRKISDQFEGRPCEAFMSEMRVPHQPQRPLHLSRRRGRLRRGPLPR